jgi:hypothetical protein
MKDNRDEIYSKSLRAGRRTYFFDVRSTRADDFYLTVTESKRDFNTDGTPFYKKHKIYLYKEDFQNFKDHMNEMMDYIIKERGEEIISLNKEKIEEETNSIIEKTEVTKITEPIEPKEDSITEFTEVNFDDLGKEEKE